MLNLFPKGSTSVDIDQLATLLQDELEVDSWQSFFELSETDLDGVQELQPFRTELLQLIKFVNGMYSH